MGTRTLALVTSLVVLTPGWAVDRARVEMRVDRAIERLGLSGRGVLVGIIDSGIDFRSADFRNEDGTTRIQFLFDLTDDTGAIAAGNIYKAGTIYTREQIDRALRGDPPPINHRDAIGRGTAAAGIVAGSGRNSTQRVWRGIAPNATLIVVKVTAGAPAHDTQPAEAAYYRPERVLTAIDFIRDRVRELALPCVMLLNVGSQEGPTDGTSAFARKIDETASIPGLIIVNGTGEDGGVTNRATGRAIAQDTVTLTVQKGVAAPLRLEIWYAQFDLLDVTILTPTSTSALLRAPDGDSDTDTLRTTEFFYTHNGTDVTFHKPVTRKRQIVIDFTGPAALYEVRLRGRVVLNGRFDATLNPSQVWNETRANRFLNAPAIAGSIWDGATASKVIAPNSYVLRTQWTDADGILRTLTGQGAAGELWLGSSVGPTVDGRSGVDLSAPGTVVTTTYSPTSYYATLRNNVMPGTLNQYGILSGVAAAAPLTAGVVALMLEANPLLTATDVKQTLQQTARRDSFTGTAPNPNWGYGKIDAEAALTGVPAPPPPAPAPVLRINDNGLVNAASFTPGPAAPDEFVSVFGENFTITSATAGALPLPTTLADTTIRIADSSGTPREAGLFAVTPTQINLVIPAATAPGASTLTLVKRDGRTVSTPLVVERVAPGLFTANFDGRGAPAAVALRVLANGTQTQEPVYQCGTTAGSCVPVAINLGPASDQMFLLLFGTGIRGRTALANVSVRIGGELSEVSYAGASTFAGLDQVNVRIPRTLSGRSEVDLVLTVDGKVANTVRVRIL